MEQTQTGCRLSMNKTFKALKQVNENTSSCTYSKNCLSKTSRPNLKRWSLGNKTYRRKLNIFKQPYWQRRTYPKRRGFRSNYFRTSLKPMFPTIGKKCCNLNRVINRNSRNSDKKFRRSKRSWRQKLNNPHLPSLNNQKRETSCDLCLRSTIPLAVGTCDI